MWYNRKFFQPGAFDEMARRIAEAANISKIRSKIRFTLEALLNYAEGSGLINNREGFLWHPEMQGARNRSALSRVSKKLMNTAPEEMTNGLIKVVSYSIAIQPQVAIPLVARLLGFNRVSEEIKKRIIGYPGAECEEWEDQERWGIC